MSGKDQDAKVGTREPAMTTSPPGALQRVERELERIGLLLEHDKELPSVTLLVAGEPIRGSWWGHALGFGRDRAHLAIVSRDLQQPASARR